MSATASVHATVNLWFSPSGSTASGTSFGFASGSPHQFDWAWLKLNVLSDTAPLTASDKTVVLNFLPGTHANAELHDDFTANCANWRLTVQGATAAGGVPVSGEVVLQFPGHVPYGAADDGNGATGVIQFASKSLGVGKEFARVVVQNLTLDGNWDAQDYIGAHYPRGYKNQPLSVSARTGRIRNVIVRNYGSHGLAPWSAYDSASGVECFPLNVGTTDVGQEPEDGDPRPWVVEDCEVTGFRGVYGGYNTAILAQVRGNDFSTDPTIAQWYTPPVFANDTTRRMVLVRRCQVRGGPGGVGMIGLGTAGIGGQA